MAERVGFEVALQERSYRGGQPPRRLPMKGTHPLQNPCSNPRHWRDLSRRQELFMTAPGRASSVWRRGWDSNPRSSYPDSSFRDCPIRPLSHLSVRRLCRSSGGMCVEMASASSTGRAYRGAVKFSIGFLSTPSIATIAPGDHPIHSELGQ